jgi:ribosome-binding protein aMBF1 (putative translation factor)
MMSKNIDKNMLKEGCSEMPKCDICGATVGPHKYEMLSHGGKEYTVCVRCAPKVKADPDSYLK